MLNCIWFSLSYRSSILKEYWSFFFFLVIKYSKRICIFVVDTKDRLKKETRGYDKVDDLGEVQKICQEFVVTEGGRCKNKFYLPKHLVKGYDGDILWFNITEDEAEDNFKKDRLPKEGEYSRYKTDSITEQYDTTATTTTTSSELSQGNKYNNEERLPLIEKKDSIRNTSNGTEQISKDVGIEDWTLLFIKV